MKYALSSKKKSTRKKQSSPATSFLPSFQLPGKIRGFSNDILIHDYHYPQTIYDLFRETQSRRLDLLLKSLGEEQPIHDSILSTFTPSSSREGCLRWVYHSNYINDGQERFEASDDVSFDVRGHFCSDCELSRRFLELKPIAYETPEGETEGIFSQEGYRGESWVLDSQPVFDTCIPFEVNDKYITCELSRDLFLHVLSLVSSSVPEDFPLRNICYTFRCGNALWDVSETISKREIDDLDFQKDIIDPLQRFSNPFSREGCTIQFILPEVNPFVSDQSTGIASQECFYDSSIKINPKSNVVHSLAIQLSFARGRTIRFHCPSSHASLVDYKLVNSLLEYPDLSPYYPAILFRQPNFIRLFVYSVMYLMETRADTFSKIFSNPSEIREICNEILLPEDAERYRKRLMMVKETREKTFPQCKDIIRNCILGLRLYTE
jgi:hypothetical protein